jgi:hypothetical protein
MCRIATYILMRQAKKEFFMTVATQRPAYLAKKQQQQQQEQQEQQEQEQQFYYVLYRGEVRGKFEERKLAEKWAAAYFYLNSTGNSEVCMALAYWDWRKPMPYNRCKVLPGEMPIGEHIPLIGESHHLWEYYRIGFQTGLCYWDSESRPKNPFAWPAHRSAWTAGVEAGMTQGMLDD